MSTDNVKRPRFQLEEVQDEPTPETRVHPAEARAAKLQAASINVLMVALSTLAQKTVIAFSKCFTLLTVAAAFWLWMAIPEPTTHQLVALGGYALFTLIINWIVLRQKD